MLVKVGIEDGTDSSDGAVFRFTGGTPSYEVNQLDGRPKPPESGQEVEMSGQRFLGVSFPGAGVRDSLRESVQRDLPSVAEVRYLGDSGAAQRTAIGVNSCHGAPTEPEYEVTERAEGIVVEVHNSDCTSPSTGDGQEGTDTATNSDEHTCGEIEFESGQHRGAFGITATKSVNCADARSTASFAEGMVGDSYGSAEGFSCEPAEDEAGTTEVNYTCTKPGAKVHFAVR